MKQEVINGNNIDLLKNYPDNYFDSIVTDPPYGLGKEPIANELMKDWVEKGYHEICGKGFMGKEWDAFVPQPIFWKEVFRVLKPGGHVLAFYGTRTYDWGVMSMRFAGFEVRDCIQWLYGSGFPKSHNIEKALNKIDGVEFEEKPAEGVGFMKPNSEDWNVTKNQLIQKGESSQDAKKWSGWGTALKPANEPIVLARKPLEKGLSIAENILKWGVGGINIDASRIGNENRSYKGMSSNIPSGAGTFRDDNWQPKDIEVNVCGRFPANIILTHHEDCECKGTKKVKANFGNREYKVGEDIENTIYGKGYKREDAKLNQDENGNETIEDWDCHEDCPIRILDEQSGVSKSQRSERGNINDNLVYGKYKPQEDTIRGHSDKGGASRFFYVAKASKAERNKGLEDFEAKRMEGRDEGQDERSVAYKARPTPMANIHPTVKPIKLMQYLVKMITPPNGIVLDPFCGSGTTGVACKLDGFKFVGLEQDPEYCKIAQARINNYIQNPNDYQNNTQESQEPTIDNNEEPQLTLF